MIPQKQTNAVKIRDHENVFLAHYQWLFERARKLSQITIQEAEDLVQDVYVRFVQTAATPDLDDSDRVRGYLFRILENLFIERHRRGRRDALQSLEIIDFDSIEYAIASVDRSHLLQVRTDLAKVCEYASIRRRTSRAASALILRFFLGYFPSELVAIFRTNRSTVDGFIRKSRQEARVFLTRPGVLQFMGENVQQNVSNNPNLPEDPSDLFAELRRRIFSDPVGECLSEEEIDARYADSSKSSLSTIELAHIVSCRRCLDRVNKAIGIQNPTPSGRSVELRDWSENLIKLQAGDGGSPIAMLRRKLRERYEHRPEKLQVAIDGEIIAAQYINGVHNEFQIRLEPFHRLRSIELLSEQGISLLFMDLEDVDLGGLTPEGAVTQLSDARELSVQLAYGGGAQVVSVSYFDPVLEEISQLIPDDPMILATISPVKNSATSPRISGKRGWPRFLSWRFGSHWQWPLSIAVALGLIAGARMHFGNRAPVVISARTPSEILAESAKARIEAIPIGGAEHRTFIYEVHSVKGHLLQSGQVELLRTRDSKQSALRLTDPAGKLIAGRWVDSRGNLASYSRKTGISHPPERTASPMLSDGLWIHAPEADDFKELVHDAGDTTVDHQPDADQLNYRSTVVHGSPRVISAHLRIAARSMRPVFETFRIEDHKQLRDYEFRELTYEVIPADRLKESDFDPDPELASFHPTITGPSNFVGRDAHSALEALLLLNNLGLEVERVVDLTRLPAGDIELDGVFATAAEKDAVVTVFRPLQQQSGGHIKLALRSEDEVAERKSTSVPMKIETLPTVSLDTEHIPLDAQFRTALSAQGFSGELLNARIREIASDARNRASQIHRETWTIHDIAANDFSREELSDMGPKDKMLWLTLLDKHLRSLSQEMATLANDLAPLFPHQGIAPTEDFSPPIPRNTSELGSSAEALNRDGTRLDQLLTTVLTLRSTNAPANCNIKDIAHLLAALKSKENALHGTIEHLQAFGQDYRN